MFNADQPLLVFVLVDFMPMFMSIFVFSCLGFDGVVVWLARKCDNKENKRMKISIFC